jgi:excisionase family DNA binding protein
MNHSITKPVSLLTEKDVAKMLNVNVQTLRNWRFQGRGLPYMKLGRAVRYDAAEVSGFIEACRVSPHAV